MRFEIEHFEIVENTPGPWPSLGRYLVDAESAEGALEQLFKKYSGLVPEKEILVVRPCSLTISAALPI